MSQKPLQEFFRGVSEVLDRYDQGMEDSMWVVEAVTVMVEQTKALLQRKEEGGLAPWVDRLEESSD